MFSKRLLETFAMLAIGDCVLGIISPTRHLSLWADGPKVWRRTVEPFIKRPTLTRTLAAVGLCGAVWLAWRQEPSAPAAWPERRSHNGRYWTKRLAEAMQ